MDLPRFGSLDAVIFDLDGTLVDTAPDLGDALNHLLVEHRRNPIAPEGIRRMIGDGAAKLVERGFIASGGLPSPLPSLVQRFLAIYEPIIADRSRPFPGVTATLARLVAAGIRLGVCTNKPDIATRRLLATLDLARYFDAVSGGDVPARKPDARHLLGVIAQLAAPPERSLMVGDSTNDVMAARNAGIPVVVVSFGYTSTPAAQLGADALIDDFAALPGILGMP
jgi:phosphoglycolate phosphatase